MAEASGIVTTDVDSLLKFVKDKKEVAIEDVAKDMSVPAETVESWASFLEEEGIIELKYKFTKPFLVYKGPKGEEVKGEKKKAGFGGLFGGKKDKEKPVEMEAAPEDKKPVEIGEAGIPEEPKKEEIKPPEKPMPEKVEKKITDINDMLQKAKEAIAKGDFDEAKKLYNEIRKKYDKLPDEFEGKKEEMMDYLYDLNKQLTLSIDTFSENDFTAKEKEIKASLAEARRAAKHKDITSATSSFSKARKAFEELPEGFIERKSVMNEEVILVHDLVVKTRKEVYARELDDKEKKIGNLIQKAETAIRKEDLEEADKTYNMIKEVQKSLPQGFMQRKIKISDKILALHSEIIDLKAEISLSEVKSKTVRITDLLNKTRTSMDNDDLDAASKTFGEAKKLYGTLPKGYIEKKFELQKAIFIIEKAILEKRTKMRKKEFKVKSKRIIRILDSVKSYIRRKNPDIAAKVYGEALQLYNDLPRGFLNKKTKIRNKMLSLYKDSIAASDTLFLMKIDPNARQRYDEMLKLIVLFHHHIESKEFNLVARDADYINKLYEELPIGLLKKKLKIIDEIAKINAEVELIAKIEDVKKTPAKDYKKLKSSLEAVYRIYDALSRKCPEDKALFAYAKQVCAPYSMKLIEKKIKPRKIGKEIVMKAEEDIARIETEQLLKAEHVKRVKDRRKKLHSVKIEEAKKLRELKKKAKEEEMKEKAELDKLNKEAEKVKKQHKEFLNMQEKMEKQKIKDELERKKKEDKIKAEAIKLEQEQLKLEEAKKKKEELEREKAVQEIVKLERGRQKKEELAKAREFKRLVAAREKEEAKLKEIAKKRDKIKKDIEKEQVRIDALRRLRSRSTHEKEIQKLKKDKTSKEADRKKLESQFLKEEREVEKLKSQEKKKREKEMKLEEEKLAHAEVKQKVVEAEFEKAEHEEKLKQLKEEHIPIKIMGGRNVMDLIPKLKKKSKEKKKVEKAIKEVKVEEKKVKKSKLERMEDEINRRLMSISNIKGETGMVVDSAPSMEVPDFDAAGPKEEEKPKKKKKEKKLPPTREQILSNTEHEIEDKIRVLDQGRIR